MYTLNYFAEYEYSIPRSRDPNIKWPWWNKQMQLKREGKIQEDLPGYMLVNWRNEMERRNALKYHPEMLAALEEE